MFKRTLSSPYFWIAEGVIIALSMALTIANIPLSITIPLIIVVGILEGILSARCDHERN